MTDWRQNASCAGSPEPWLWDAEVSGESGHQQGARHDAAIAICGGCPVKRECLADARYERDEGVRGGRLLPPIFSTSADEFRHGTEAGYAKHRRRGQQPCEPCLQAKARVSIDRYAKRKDGTNVRKPLAPCGTNAAYRRHKRAKEQPCRPCLDAHNANAAKRAVRRKAAEAAA